MNESFIDILKKVKIRYVIIALVALLFLFVAPRYAILVVSVDTPENLPQVVDYDEVDHIHNAMEDEENANLDEFKVDAEVEVTLHYETGPESIGKPGIHLVKRGVTGIEAQAGDSGATRAAFSLPWYGMSFRKMNIELDTNAEKIAYRSTLQRSCGVFSERLERMAQYACGNNPTALSFYNTSSNSWEVTTLASLYFPRATPAHYKGGLLGLTQTSTSNDVENTTEDKLIRAVSDEGDTSFFEQPEGVNCARAVCIEGERQAANNFLSQHETPAAIFTDTKNQSNERFVFVASDGTIYLGTPGENSAVSYKKFSASEEYDAGFYQTLCDIHDTFVACIQGQSRNPANTDVSTKPRPANLILLNFEEDEHTVMPIRNNAIFVDMITTSSNEIFAKEGSTLIHLHPNEKGRVEETEIARNVDKIAANSDLYYTSNRAVYEVDAESFDTHKKFSSHNINPRELIATSQSVFVLGSAPQNMAQPTYAWKLNDEPNLTPGTRTIDKIPTMPGSIAFGTNDLVGNRLYITIPTFSRSSNVTQTSINREVDSVLNSLRRSGVDIDSLEVISPASRR